MDKRLNFNAHLENVSKKSGVSLGVCPQLVLKNWELCPDKMPGLFYNDCQTNNNIYMVLLSGGLKRVSAMSGVLKSTPTTVKMLPNEPNTTFLLNKRREEAFSGLNPFN